MKNAHHNSPEIKFTNNSCSLINTPKTKYIKFRNIKLRKLQIWEAETNKCLAFLFDKWLIFRKIKVFFITKNKIIWLYSNRWWLVVLLVNGRCCFNAYLLFIFWVESINTILCHVIDLSIITLLIFLIVK